MSEKIPVGIQLYSLRTVIGDDVAGTLKQLAEMGYEGVEFAGTYNLDAIALRKMLDDAGLKTAGAHVPYDALEGDALPKTVEQYRTLGTERLIIPFMNTKEADATIARMIAIQEKAKALGVSVGFHNHQAEFKIIDGITIFDRIFQSTPPDFLVQLDIGWAQAAGRDVPAILRKYANRIESVHVKEHNADDDAAVVGEGSVDWPAVMGILEKETALKWYVVEQEQYHVDPMESARRCIENIRKMGR